MPQSFGFRLREDGGYEAKEGPLTTVPGTYAFPSSFMCRDSRMVEVTFNGTPLPTIKVSTKGAVGCVVCMLCPVNEPFFHHVWEEMLQTPPLGTSVAVETAVDTAALPRKPKRQRVFQKPIDWLNKYLG